MMMNDNALPTGFRFYPTEEELVSFYLFNKLNNTRLEIDRVIPVLDIYDTDPSHLPQLGGVYCPEDGEQWFFFVPRQEKEARGGRPNRLTARGYWKATGSPGDVYSSRNHHVIGRKKTMVFYVGRAPYGEKTPWKMTEYKAIVQSDGDRASTAIPQLREEFSLCRVYKRSKYLREFDRRPPSSGAVMSDQAVVHGRRNEAGGSFSGEGTANLDGGSGNNDQDMATDNESSWDYNWEEYIELV